MPNTHNISMAQDLPPRIQPSSPEGHSKATRMNQTASHLAAISRITQITLAPVQVPMQPNTAVACLGELTMGRFHPLATADSIYSDENNFLSLALSTSSTSRPPPVPPPCRSAAKNNKRQKQEVEGGGDSLV